MPPPHVPTSGRTAGAFCHYGVQTVLPATIEGAVQAGREAARRALAARVAPARAEAAPRAGLG